MKSELWSKVKRGDFFIFADRYEGVFRAKITETDIRFYEPGEPSSWGYPYGRTAETGTVRVEVDEVERIMNLADLIVYSIGRLATLRRYWNSYSDALTISGARLETLLAKINEWKAV